MDRIYTMDPHQNLLGNGSLNVLSSKYAFRTGGIYHNPNNCGQYLTLIMACYLIETNYKRNFRNFIFYTLIFCSVILTGSRTAATISVLLVVYYSFTSPSKNIKLIVAFIMIVLIIFIISNNLRSFNIASDIYSKREGSLGAKFGVIKYYIANNGFVQLLWGHFNIDPLKNMDLVRNYGLNILDNEIGSLLQALGLFGVIAILIFYYNIIRSGNNYTRLIVILALWSISNSVFFQFKFSFLFMLILSNYYQYKSNHIATISIK